MPGRRRAVGALHSRQRPGSGALDLAAPRNVAGEPHPRQVDEQERRFGIYWWLPVRYKPATPITISSMEAERSTVISSLSQKTPSTATISVPTPDQTA